MMKRKRMIGNIFTELKHHALFTFFGAITKRSAMLFPTSALFHILKCKSPLK